MFKDILVPIDLNDPIIWKRALKTAVEIATRFSARLHVVTVVPDLRSPLVAQYFPPDYEHEVIEKARRQLDEILAGELPSGLEAQRIIAEGTIHREITEAAARTRCDLIIIGSHHPELQDLLIGSNAEKVVRHAHCSVMVVRDPEGAG